MQRGRGGGAPRPRVLPRAVSPGELWLVETGHVITVLTADWLQMTVRGAVWYQGESNTGHHRDIYDCTFKQLISSWRAQWHAATHGEL